MMYVAIFLGAVRWLVTAIALHQGHSGGVPVDVYVMAALTCLAILCLSLPLWLGLVDSAMWCAVWLIKRRWMQAIVASFRRSQSR